MDVDSRAVLKNLVCMCMPWGVDGIFVCQCQIQKTRTLWIWIFFYFIVPFTCTHDACLINKPHPHHKLHTTEWRTTIPSCFGDCLQCARWPVALGWPENWSTHSSKGRIFWRNGNRYQLRLTASVFSNHSVDQRDKWLCQPTISVINRTRRKQRWFGRHWWLFIHSFIHSFSKYSTCPAKRHRTTCWVDQDVSMIVHK